MANFSSAVITGANSFTTPITVIGNFNVSVVGATGGAVSPGTAFVAVVTVQRSFDGTNWFDVEAFTNVEAERNGNEVENGVTYRVGIKTSGYTSGQVYCRLGGGEVI